MEKITNLLWQIWCVRNNVIFRNDDTAGSIIRDSYGKLIIMQSVWFNNDTTMPKMNNLRKFSQYHLPFLKSFYTLSLSLKIKK